MYAQTRPALLAALLLASAAWAEDAAAPRLPDDAGLGAEPPHNLCFGGLEDRKRIVPENQLSNLFRETTHLGCEVDGGQPTVMPDLPAPQRIPTALG